MTISYPFFHLKFSPFRLIFVVFFVIFV